MKRLASTIFAALIALTSLPSTANAAPTRVYLAFQGPLSGDSEIFGKDQLAAANFAIANFNKRNSSKFRVRLLSFDDEGNTEKANEISKVIASDSRIIGVIGPALSDTASAALNNFASGKLAMISPSAIRDPLIESDQSGSLLRFFHRTALTPKSQARDLYQLAVKAVALPKVFVIHHEDEYSLGLANQIRELAPPESLVTDQTPYVATSWSNSIKRIIDEKFNVVIYTGYHPQATRLLKQLSDSGYKGVVALSDGSFSPGLLLNSSKNAIEAVRLIGLTSPLSLTQKTIYETIYGAGPDARGLYAGETLDATGVFLECISKSALSRRKMNRCIDSYDGKSISSGSIRFDQNGDLVGRALPAFIVKNGVFRLFGN